jgi:cell volume regulation protein A
MPLELDALLLAGAAVLLVAVIVAKIGDRLGLPALLLFLGLGVAISAPSGFHLFDDAALAHDLGFAALVIILAEGGLSTNANSARPSCPRLCSPRRGRGHHRDRGPGRALRAGCRGRSRCWWARSWRHRLGGRVLGLRQVPPSRALDPRGESRAQRRPDGALVVAMTEIATGAQTHGYLMLALVIAGELVGGIVLGLALGWVGVRLLRQLALPASGLDPLASLGWAVLAYGAGVALHLSGFAAVYVCSVALSHGKLPHRHATRSFAEGIGWFAQIGLFVMLGLLAVPPRIEWSGIVNATVAGLALTFVARPLAVAVCLTPFRVPWREQAFVSWAGLRGAVPIILATVPLERGMARADDVFDLTFVAVIVLTLLNAPSLPWVAARLGWPARRRTWTSSRPSTGSRRTCCRSGARGSKRTVAVSSSGSRPTRRSRW